MRPANPRRSYHLQLRYVDFRLRVSELHLFKRLNDNAGDRHVSHPLVVRRNHVPWRPFRAAFRERVFVSRDVIVPALALFQVGQRELPAFRRILNALTEALLLLSLADMKKEL